MKFKDRESSSVVTSQDGSYIQGRTVGPWGVAQGVLLGCGEVQSPDPGEGYMSRFTLRKFMKL